MIDLNDKRLPERFWVKVSVMENGCWEWTAATNSRGYGVLRADGRTVLAHRFAMEAATGPLPVDRECDHLCRNRRCVNPRHIELVLGAENTRRGAAGQATRARHAAKSHCPKGHPYDAANTIWYVKQG